MAATSVPSPMPDLPSRLSVMPIRPGRSASGSAPRSADRLSMAGRAETRSPRRPRPPAAGAGSGSRSGDRFRQGPRQRLACAAFPPAPKAVRHAFARSPRTDAPKAGRTLRGRGRRGHAPAKSRSPGRTPKSAPADRPRSPRPPSRRTVRAGRRKADLRPAMSDRSPRCRAASPRRPSRRISGDTARRPVSVSPAIVRSCVAFDADSYQNHAHEPLGHGLIDGGWIASGRASHQDR